MSTLILDFDSTLIPHESLERVLARGGASASDLARIEGITQLGMQGAIPFGESLRRRLDIARPRRSLVAKVGFELAADVPTAAVELVAWHAARGGQTWLLSGALREVLLPTAARLGIAEERVLAVTTRWSDDDLLGLVPDGFDEGKVAGVRAAAPRWTRPSVIVGDGATDRALVEAGLVDHFIAFVGHVRRPGIADAPGALLARDFDDVARILERLGA